MSKEETIAYIAAFFHGGGVSQSAIVFRNTEKILDIDKSGNGINEALKLLNVKRDDVYDEFESIKLGRFRNTDDWVKG